MVAMPAFASDILWDYLEKQGRNAGLVIQTPNSSPISPGNLVWHFKDSLNIAALPDIRFHDFPDTAATLLLSKGVQPKVVQELLGHSRIHLTLDTYSHVIPSLQYEVAEKMDAIFK